MPLAVAGIRVGLSESVNMSAEFYASVLPTRGRQAKHWNKENVEKRLRCGFE